MVNNIWVAAADNDLETVQNYISTGQFSANSKDPNGYTPIHAAVSYGHVELLKYLIQQGGDINTQDTEGDAPLHHVEDLQVAKLLKEDDEFPEVVQYLRSLNHDNPTENNNLLDTLPRPDEVEGHKISYSYQNEDIELQIDDAQREQLREIAESENPEAKLRDFVKEAVHNQFFNGDNDNSPASKKRRD
ncbi:unnamed protein product [Wickerhamomyces anomalus]